MKKAKIEKINIDDLYPDNIQAEYEAAKNKYISEYQVYIPGGFLSIGYYKNEPAVGESKWNSSYPNGMVDWRNKGFTVNYDDLKYLASKINEIIDSL